MDIKEYQHWVKDTLDTPHKHTSRQDALVHFVLGLNGEIGEVTEIVKKQLYGGKIPEEPIIGELGDVLWYLTALCSTLDITFEELINHNYQKLNHKYNFTVKDTCIGCKNTDTQRHSECMNAAAQLLNRGCDKYER